ncbi:hypothetical protein VPH35_089167 [Triticum aestivum]
MAAARDLAGNQPGSTRVCIGEDVAWSDVTGVYDRDDSLKENTNPKCFNVKNYPGHKAGNGAAQRFSGNLKPTAAPIIGISGNLGQGCARRHRPPAMFPKNAKTGGEPGSPKVSCMGKVLSGRERDRRRELISREKMKGGCCPWFGFPIRPSRSRKSAVESVDWSPPPRLPLAYVERKMEAKEVSTDQAAPPAPAPALAGMRRFASGRRVADWAAGTEEDGRLARSGPL